MEPPPKHKHWHQITERVQKARTQGDWGKREEVLMTDDILFHYSWNINGRKETESRARRCCDLLHFKWEAQVTFWHQIHPEPKDRDVRFKLDFKCVATCISSIRKENLDHNHALAPISRIHMKKIMLHRLQCSSEAVQAVSSLRTLSSHTDPAQKYISFVPAMCNHLWKIKLGRWGNVLLAKLKKKKNFKNWIIILKQPRNMFSYRSANSLGQRIQVRQL